MSMYKVQAELALNIVADEKGSEGLEMMLRDLWLVTVIFQAIVSELPKSVLAYDRVVGDMRETAAPTYAVLEARRSSRVGL